MNEIVLELEITRDKAGGMRVPRCPEWGLSYPMKCLICGYRQDWLDKDRCTRSLAALPHDHTAAVRCAHPSFQKRQPKQPPAPTLREVCESLLRADDDVICGWSQCRVNGYKHKAREAITADDAKPVKPAMSTSLKACHAILQALRHHDSSGSCASNCKLCRLFDLATDAVEEEGP